MNLITKSKKISCKLNFPIRDVNNIILIFHFWLQLLWKIDKHYQLTLSLFSRDDMFIRMFLTNDYFVQGLSINYNIRLISG